MKISRFLALAAVLLLAACGPKTAPAPGSAEGRTAIRFATDWRAEAEQGGFYEALANGEYAKRGLDVTIVPGGPGTNVPQLVAAGAVDMGIGSNSFIVMNLAAEHVPVRAVAAFMQKDPQVLIAHPDAGIHTLADMKGHPILLSDASVTAFWVWLKAKYGFTDSQVRKYTFNNAPFLADKRLVQQGYLTSEPYTLEKEAHMKPAVFLLADEGYPGYAGMVLASDRLIAAKPAAVQAFIEASAAGWQAYLHGDPAPGDALILKDNPEMTPDVLAQAREKMRRYGIVDVTEPKNGPLGSMTDDRWGRFFAVASDKGVFPKTLDYKRPTRCSSCRRRGNRRRDPFRRRTHRGRGGLSRAGQGPGSFRPDSRGGRDRRPGRPVRLRKVHSPAASGRPGSPDAGHGPARGRAGRDLGGVPVADPGPVAQRHGERRPAAGAGRHAIGGSPGPFAGGSGSRRPGRCDRRPAGAAFRRHGHAGLPGPRAGHPAKAAAARRALRRA